MSVPDMEATGARATVDSPGASMVLFLRTA
jgi:hypothetical protein